MKKNMQTRVLIDDKFSVNENSDLEDKSYHFTSYNKDAIKERALQNIQIQKKIKDLEQDLYGY